MSNVQSEFSQCDYKRLISEMADNADEALPHHPELWQAFIGIARQGHRYIAVYDESAAIRCLQQINDWDEETAVEWYEFNVVGAYLGPQTPMFLVETRDQFVDRRDQINAYDGGSDAGMVAEGFRSATS